MDSYSENKNSAQLCVMYFSVISDQGKPQPIFASLKKSKEGQNSYYHLFL